MQDRTARLWNVKTGQEVLQIKLKEKGARVAFSQDGKVIAVATQPVWGSPPQSIVGLFDTRTGQLLREFRRSKAGVSSQRGYCGRIDSAFLKVGLVRGECELGVIDINHGHLRSCGCMSGSRSGDRHRLISIRQRIGNGRYRESHKSTSGGYADKQPSCTG